MGTTDYGSQVLSFDYKAPGKSETFNKLNYKLTEKGIYDGGYLSYIDATHVSVNPFTAFCKDSVAEVGVRVETTNPVTIEVASGNPFLIIRFSWSNVENNYADILAVSFGSILSDDIIIGRCMFPSGALSLDFDYSRRDSSYSVTKRNSKRELTVIPTEPYSDQVYVYGGTFFNSDKKIVVASSSSSSFSGVSPNTIADARIDLLYIDDDGNIQIEEGVDAPVPVAPLYNSRKVLAEIYLDNTDDYIDGTSITLVDVDTAIGTDGIKNLDDKLNPIGTVKMFDANNAGGGSGGSSGAWVDNVTIPGWYACITANSDYGCPNLVDTFIMGKDISGSGISGGSNTHTISASELPLHDHGIASHNHGGYTGYITVNHSHYQYRETNSNGSGIQLAANDSHAPASYTSEGSDTEYRTRYSDYYASQYTDANTGRTNLNIESTNHRHTIATQATTNTDNGGFANDVIDTKPAYYSVIYIRKCK